MYTVEIHTLPIKNSRTFRDRIRNTDIRRLCNITNVTKLIKNRRKYWNHQEDKMDNQILANKGKTNLSIGKGHKENPLIVEKNVGRIN